MKTRKIEMGDDNDDENFSIVRKERRKQSFSFAGDRKVDKT